MDMSAGNGARTSEFSTNWRVPTLCLYEPLLLFCSLTVKASSNAHHVSNVGTVLTAWARFCLLACGPICPRSGLPSQLTGPCFLHARPCSECAGDGEPQGRVQIIFHAGRARCSCRLRSPARPHLHVSSAKSRKSSPHMSHHDKFDIRNLTEWSA